MKLSTTLKLKNIDGQPLLEPGPDNSAIPVTLRAVLTHALMFADEADTGETKAAKYGLAIEIQRMDEVVLKTKQVELLKASVGKPFGPVVVGQVYEILDGLE